MTAERLAPDAILALTNLSGAVTDIDDDPDAPDAAWLTASGNDVDTAVRVSFPSPSGNPTAGADLQEFRVQARRFDTGQTGIPAVRIELWENGVLVRAGPTAFIGGVGGVLLVLDWDAGELATADGSLVECNVIGTKSGGGPSVRNTVEIGAIEWNAEVAAAGNSVAITGAVTVAPSVGATLGHMQNAALVGAVTATVTVGAGLDFTLNAALAGAVTLIPGVAAGTRFGRDLAISGAVTVASAVRAALDFAANAALAGALSVTPGVAALLAHNRHGALAGSIALGSTVAAAMAHAASGGIAGALTVTPGVAALLAHNLHAVLAGGVSLAVLSAAGLASGGPGVIRRRSALSGEVELSELAGKAGAINLTGKVM